MVGSIDPRCETVRGTHWPKPGRVVVWSSRRGNHLGQRSRPTASTGRTYGCKRSDQTVKKLLCHGGRPHMGPCVPGTTKMMWTRNRNLQRRKHRLGNIRGAVLAAELHRLDATGISLVDSAFDALAGFRGLLDAVLVGEPVQHHRGREDHAGRVSLALPHDVGRSAVAGLEHRMAV